MINRNHASVSSIVVSTSRCGRDIPGSNPGWRKTPVAKIHNLVQLIYYYLGNFIFAFFCIFLLLSFFAVLLQLHVAADGQPPTGRAHPVCAVYLYNPPPAEPTQQKASSHPKHGQVPFVFIFFF